MEGQHNKLVRIFVGGLGESITKQDLHSLLSSFGNVEAVETIRTKGRSFAYLDFLPSPTDDKSLSRLFSKYNGCVWKGGKLKLEKAKEHYLVRLKREWDEDAMSKIEHVSDKPVTTDKLEEKPTKESLKTKQLHIYFPRLRKVKSIPFTGTGKHKYSFQNIKVPLLPVHFCDCKEHCSPSGTEKGKLHIERATEIGGMNDEEINIMNVVMNKLFGKENVSEKKNLETEDSFESPAHPDDSEVGSSTDEDDLIINVNTKKNKSSIIGSEELQMILENQDSWSNKSKIGKEENDKSESDVHKGHKSNPNNKGKSLRKSERESIGHVSTTAKGKNNVQTLPDEVESGVQLVESEDDFGKPSKVLWSQKSSWKELLGNGGNTAFNATLIFPTEQERPDSPSQSISLSDKTENMEGHEHLGSEPTDTESTKELTEDNHTNTSALRKHAEAQPGDNNVELKKTGRGASWRRKQSWTQLVAGDNSSFSISQILAGITFSEPMAKGSTMDPANSNNPKHNNVGKDAINEVVTSDGRIPEKSQHDGGGANDTAYEEKSETREKEGSSEETVQKERSIARVEVGETCTFMRSCSSLKEWAKAKAALSGSLKRKRPNS
ncbi:hypothetical protein Ahy_A05g023229 isoform K [Arachis hypogaea]|uniref:RRM domain-containing protein n=1 Tax=Arachis hypogaea TaxID=3818 RepID=A0A445D2P4_ARAHY|nr:hypothetical protein Ahy_A05g023229 isoform K [Arachis hypogaea]